MRFFFKAAHSIRIFLTVVLALVCLTGCTSIPEGQRAVTGFDIKGNNVIDSDDLEKKLATQTTSKFFGFRGIVYEYEIYDRYSLERDVARIERYYRARGFYDARVRVVRVQDISGDRVEVELQVAEGTPVRVARIEFEWTEAVPERARRAAEAEAKKVAEAEEKRFDEDKFAEAERGIVRALGNHGYAAAAATRDAEVDIVRNEAILKYRITPGEPAVFGEVTFVGRGEIPEAPVRRAFGIKPGEDYSLAALEDSRQALLDLGVFATVDIIPDLASEQREAGGRARKVVPVRVELEVSKLRALRFGGGLELSSTRFDVHLLAGWRGDNTLGDLRRVELTFQPGVVFYPVNITNIQAPEALLPFQKTRATLRRPAFLEQRTVLLLSAQYAIFPQLFPQKTENVIGYHELTTTAGVQRPFGRLLVQPTYGFQANFPYNAVGFSPQKLDPVLISYVELLSYLDYRNNPLRPTKGAYFANTLQYAGGPFGGSADDVRIQPEARGYIALSKKVSIALRAAVGFLFPRNYTQYSSSRYGKPETAAGVSQSDLSRDYQILYFRGLFSGGPTSNRGYALRGVGPHDAIPYLIPAVQAAQAAGECSPDNPDPKDECLLPVGGLSQWESTVELRFTVSGPFLAATFCDAGDVSPFGLLQAAPAGSSQSATPLRFDRLHLSCGVGARYDTPAGPIRFDLGFRIPGMQTLGDSTGEGVPPTLFGVPVAINFGIGEAF